MHPRALIVAGPTASGKSALALALAERFAGTVINADAMQCYRELRVLTARLSATETARVPHRLYGVRAAAEPATAAWWRGAALEAMAAAVAAGRLPILCGGTGLYLRALTEGLSDVPPVPAAARAEARARLAAEGAPALHARLAAIDAATASTLRPSDSQRVARAFEVAVGTGRGLVAWRAAGAHSGPAPYRFAAVLMVPPRAVLRDAAAVRLDAMLAAGAVAEVAALAALGLDPALPLLRAHGVPALLAHVRGELALDAARARALADTVAYVKRQATWFRHHALAAAADTHSFHARFTGLTQDLERDVASLFAFVEARVDAAQQGA